MAETKYGKYFLTEPIERGPMLHVCGDEACYGKMLSNFPVEVQMLCLSRLAGQSKGDIGSKTIY